MEMLQLLLFVWCATLVSSFDLGPMLRVAQCRSQCLRKHSLDGSCDWFSNRSETVCSECWQNCESLENQWEANRAICEGDEYSRCPACQTACQFRKTRVEEEYMPSTLPSPHRGPVTLGKNDVAIVLRKVHHEWKQSGYYPGIRAPSLRADTWIVAIVEDGIIHFSWQEWIPTVDSLKEGPLFEATISWRDVDAQLKRQQALEQKRFNDRVRQFFLEKYGEKVLVEWRDQDRDSQIPEEVFRRLFFKRKEENQDINEHSEPLTGNASDGIIGGNSLDDSMLDSYVVSWEPESGGLMGNQVTDTNFAQISLLPGTKYLVRIASNEGPGSFPIEIDTRPSTLDGTVHITKISDYNKSTLALAICLFFTIMLAVCAYIVWKSCNKVKAIEPVEDV